MASSGILFRRADKNILISQPPLEGEMVFAIDTQEIGFLENGSLIWKKFSDISNLNSLDLSDYLKNDKLNIPNGIATLDSNRKLLNSQIPLDTLKNYEIFNTFNDFPITGESNKLYLDNSTDTLYRWNTNTSTYIGLSGSSLNITYGTLDFNSIPNSDKKNGAMFTDTDSGNLYAYSTDLQSFYQLAKNIEFYNTYNDFPVFGKQNILYIDKSDKKTYIYVSGFRGGNYELLTDLYDKEIQIYNTYSQFPVTGEDLKFYFEITTFTLYYWDFLTSSYIPIAGQSANLNIDAGNF